MRLDELRQGIAAFNRNGQLGADPLAALYIQRRAAYSLFSPGLSGDEVEALRPYVFPWERLPATPSDAPIRVHNLIDGEWRAPTRGEYATLRSHADDRIPLLQLPASTSEDVEQVLAAADRAWKSFAWAEEGLAYR